MKLLGSYINGNYNVDIYNDGTKVRTTEDDIFSPTFPESIDLKITNYCDAGCAYCHEGSSLYGSHGDIMNLEFIDTLHPYTEIALGGGNPFSHPDLLPFLRQLKDRKIIANITINQIHFEGVKEQKLIQYLIKEELIYGLGVSLYKASEDFVKLVQKYDNTVVHLINGLFDYEDVNILKDNNLKILILGYKQLRRGINYYDVLGEEIVKKQQWLYRNLYFILGLFQIVSFDNLAIEQLNVKRILTEEEWNRFFMGEDGDFTLYIDAVSRKVASSSISKSWNSALISIEDIFNTIRREHMIKIEELNKAIYFFYETKRLDLKELDGDTTSDYAQWILQNHKHIDIAITILKQEYNKLIQSSEEEEGE